MAASLQEGMKKDGICVTRRARTRLSGVDRLMLAMIRAYGEHFPVRRGKGRMASLLFPLLREKTAEMVVASQDGRRFHVCLGDQMMRSVLLFREYEPFETRVLSYLVREGDVVIDAGANFGWYTTLFSRLVGKSGSVHSFEPVPFIFRKLWTNCRLNSCQSNAILNRSALGRESGVGEIHVFAGLKDGHASLSDLGRTDGRMFPCEIITLDAYVERHGVGRIDLVKCDVEGSEMAVLEGSSSVLSGPDPPVWLMELNRETAVHMGYEPSDLVGKLLGFGYEVLEIDPQNGRLRPFQEIGSCRSSINVLCIRPGEDESRTRKLRARGLLC